MQNIYIKGVYFVLFFKNFTLFCFVWFLFQRKRSYNENDIKDLNCLVPVYHRHKQIFS